MSNNNHCIICKSTIDKKHLFYNTLLKCHKCGLVFEKEFPTDYEIKDIYSKNYFEGEEHRNYTADKEIFERNFRRNINIIQNYSRQGNLLEIGCAYGFFLKLASKSWQVKGIDISYDGCKYAKEVLGLDVICDDFLNVSFNENEFDVICLWDTIEHLKYPNLYIEKCYKYLKSGGIICITTGDINSFNARFRRGKWRLIHLPTHLYYFSKSSIQSLLNKYGFKVTHIRYAGFYRRISTMLHQISLNLKQGILKNMISWLSKKTFARRNLYINLYDIMLVIAKKV